MRRWKGGGGWVIINCKQHMPRSVRLTLIRMCQNKLYGLMVIVALATRNDASTSIYIGLGHAGK